VPAPADAAGSSGGDAPSSRAGSTDPTGPAGPSDTPPAVLVSAAAIRAYRESLSGTLVIPGDPDYDDARAIFNAAIRRHPGFISYCQDAADVALSVRFATDHHLPLSVRSGGCSPTGFCLNDGGLVVDVSRLNEVSRDRAGGRVTVGAGTRMSELYAQLVPRGFVVPGGECPNVAVSGLTLGGGVSLLGRSLGFTVDSVEALEVVTADGEVRTVDDDHEPDLYWALRGAGASFGVVTELTLRPSPIGKTVYAGSVTWSLDRAAGALAAAFRYLASDAPDELDAVFIIAGQRDPSTGAVDQKLLCIPVYNGDPTSRRAVEAIHALTDHPGGYSQVEAWNYLDLLESDFHAERQRPWEFWKSGFIGEPPDRTQLDALIECFRDNPSSLAIVAFEMCGGKMNEVPPDAMAFVHRKHFALLSIFANSAGRDPAAVTWARRFHHRLMELGVYTRHRYQNYPDPSLENWPHAYYADNYPKLQRLKARYDPGQVFYFQQSVRPAG